MRGFGDSLFSTENFFYPKISSLSLKFAYRKKWIYSVAELLIHYLLNVTSLKIIHILLWVYGKVRKFSAQAEVLCFVSVRKNLLFDALERKSRF